MSTIDETRTEDASASLDTDEVHLNHAQEIANLGSWKLDISTDTLYWSDEVTRIFAVPETEELSYQRFLEFVHPEDEAFVRNSWAAALDGDEYDIEHRIVTGDGDVRWVRERATVEFDEEKNPITALGVVQDITDRKEREREVEASQKWLRALLRAAPDPIFVADVDTGEIIEANSAAETLRNQPREEIIGLHQTELHPQEDEDAYRRLFENAAKEGWTRRQFPDGTQIYAVRDDGTRLPVEISVETVEHADRNVIFGIFRDISERQEQRSRLETQAQAMEASIEGISILDEDGNYTYVNRAYADTFGYDPEHLQGESWKRLYGTEEIGRIEESVLPAVEGTGEWRGELVGQKRDGSPVFLEGTFSRLEDGKLICTCSDITERKQREKHLEKAQDVGTLGWWRKEIQSDRLYWSEQVYEMWGVEDDIGPLGHGKFLEFVHPDDERAVKGAWKAALDGDEYDIEHRIVRGDGEIRWMRQKGEITFDDQGNPISAIGIVQDVTDRKERERDLRRFKRAIEVAGHSVCITDRDGTIEYVNSTFESDTGYPEAEVLGRTPRIIQSGEHDEQFYEELWDTILAGKMWQGEVINERKDGEQYIVDQTIAPVTNQDGEITNFVAINTDITDLKEKQRELHELRQAVENAQTPLLLADPVADGNPIVYANEAAQELTGYPSQELLGENCRLLHGPETDPDTVDDLETAIENEEPITVQLRSYRKDGTLFWNEFTMTPVYDTDGTLIRTLCTLQDITKRTEREQHLHVVDRVLRHNLRNDMQIISGYAETIQAEAESEVANAAQSIVNKSADLLETADKQRAITDVLLEQPTLEEIRIDLLFENVVRAVKEDYPDATINIDCPDESTVIASPRLYQAFQELVDNAVRHNREPTPKVRISVTKLDEYTRIEIKDNGPLIPQMERDVGTSGQERDPLYHGSGLGLWFAYWVVTRSNGTIAFEERDSRGNQISVELPRKHSG